jgi:prolipoprotein diacylglyceryltransferase
MAIISRSIKVFLFILGILLCIILNARDRFDDKQILSLIIIIFSFTILTWVCKRNKKKTDEEKKCKKK